MKLRPIEYVNFLKDLLTGRRSNGEYQGHLMRLDDLKPLQPQAHPLYILDLANGRLRPQSTILSREGHFVVGIDLVNAPEASITNLFYRFARFLFQLRLPKKALQARNPAFVCGSVSTLPFRDNSFDQITSVAALEHFLDVPSVLFECNRVLRPGGVMWALIHVFTTLSGGHNVSMSLGPLSRLPAGMAPWDHLRDRTIPFTVPLNEWRIQDYRKEFEKYFEIINERPTNSEGLELLTPALRAELSEYSEEELTCASYLFVLRKVS